MTLNLEVVCKELIRDSDSFMKRLAKYINFIIQILKKMTRESSADEKMRQSNLKKFLSIERALDIFITEIRKLLKRFGKAKTFRLARDDMRKLIVRESHLEKLLNVLSTIHSHIGYTSHYLKNDPDTFIQNKKDLDNELSRFYSLITKYILNPNIPVLPHD